MMISSYDFSLSNRDSVMEDKDNRGIQLLPFSTVSLIGNEREHDLMISSLSSYLQLPRLTYHVQVDRNPMNWII